MPNSRNVRFMELYREYHNDLSHYCRSLDSDQDRAKDLMGETITRAIESFHKVKDPSRFRAFLISVARNIYKEQLRKKRIADIHDQHLQVNIYSPSAGEHHSVYKIVNQLPKSQAEVFILFEISDLPLAEIAEIQNTNISTIKTRLSRARMRLKTLLSEEFNTYITKF